MKNGKRVIVSMTSWSKRIGNVATVLKTILEQTVKPDLIEINLSLIEFPNKENDLPQDLNELISNNKEIEINWLEKNDYSFKKIIPTIQKFFGEDYYLVSIDDDYLYWNEFIEKSIWELESNGVNAFNFSTTPIWGNKQIYKSTCFDKDFWEDLTQELIDTKHDDLYIRTYLKFKNKKIYYYKPTNFYEIFEPFNQEYSISQNGLYNFYDINNAYELINKIFINKLEKMRNLKKFETAQEQQSYVYKNDCVSYVVETNSVKIDAPDYSKNYLTFIPLSSSAFGFVSSQNEGILNPSIQYSVDDGLTWKTLAHQGWTEEITANSKILFKGNCQSSGDGVYDVGIGHIMSLASFNVEGNIMSLFYGDDFADKTTMSKFTSLNGFFIESEVIDASNLILPATTLYEACYSSMFSFSTITKAPKLLAMTLASSCYQSMFSHCTSLTTAPDLLAPTLVYACYWGMFDTCSNLNYIKMLATNISANNCLREWADDVSATGTFVKSANAPSSLDYYIPSGWTVETE